MTYIGAQIQCHLCGRGYDLLNVHVRRTHEMTPDAYRAAFGLPPTLGLVSDRVHVKMREKLNRLAALGYPNFRPSQRRDAGQIEAHACIECGASIMSRRRLEHQRLLCNRPACRTAAHRRTALTTNGQRSPAHQQRLTAALHAFNDTHRIVHEPLICPWCHKSFAYVRRVRYCSIRCAALHRWASRAAITSSR